MKPSSLSVTIIIPVFNAYEDTKKCIESVLQYTNIKHNILLVNDASTDQRINELLADSQIQNSQITILQNQHNLGFVKTCNRAFRESEQSNDIVLLNSDTLVTPNWLEKIISAAYSNINIATVTPLTNNGTICSVPVWLEYNDIPEGHTIISFANLIEGISTREYPKIPTAVGFCMYIKRNVLNEVGYFDEVNFGLGYGEENDFCCRASNLGYSHIIDDATFVYHAGSKSFGEKKTKLIETNLQNLSRIHPSYLRRVDSFIKEKPIQKILDNIELNLFLLKVKQLSPICFILHNSIDKPSNFPLGGTEYHCAALIEELKNDIPIYTLYFDKYKSSLCLSVFYGSETKSFIFKSNKSHLSSHLYQDNDFSSLFTDIVRYFQPSIIHIHHLMFLPIRDVLSVLLKEKISYLVSIHDYYFICPSYNLIDYTNNFCYEYKNEGHCKECSQKLLGSGADLKYEWSNICAELLKNAQLVITPSPCTASYISREYEYTKTKNNLKIIRHGIYKQDVIDRVIKGRSNKQATYKPSPLKLGFVGSINVQKGAEEIINLIKRINSDSTLKHKFEFNFFGKCSEYIQNNSNVKVIGNYDRQNLHKLLTDIDVVVFPIVWAETYCLTADEVLMCGIPIISYPVGAIAERINLFNVGWVSKSSSVDDLLAILSIITEEELQKMKKNIDDYIFVSYEEMSSCYLDEYRNIQVNYSSDLKGIEKNQKIVLTSKDIFLAYKKQSNTNLSFSFLDKVRNIKILYMFLSLIKRILTVWKHLRKLILSIFK